MMQALVDTNVILDVLLDRQPHAVGSTAVWKAIETGLSKGFLATHAITTIHYLYRKEHGTARATRVVSSILRVFDVAAVDGAILQEALRLGLPDFEDSVTAAAAQFAGCDFIVTRDPKGYRGSPVRHLAPEAYLPLLRTE
jgi:predicted nucleic acid-binding protein